MIQGLDALAAIMVAAFAAISIVWIINSMKLQMSIRQVAFLAIICITLGVFIESYIRGTREAVLATVALILEIGAWWFTRAKAKVKMMRQPMRPGQQLLALLLVGATLLPALACLPPAAQAYTSVMHQDISDMALEVLNSDGHAAEVEALLAKTDQATPLFLRLKDGILDCDRLDLAADHYYDPNTKAGLAGCMSSADLAQESYDLAISLWRGGEWSVAIYELGRALHMVMDATVPYHSKLQPLDGHVEYETWCYDHEGLYLAFSNGLYGRGSAKEYVHCNALLSLALYDQATYPATYAEVAQKMVPQAARSAAGLLDLFFHQVQELDLGLRPCAGPASAHSVTVAWSPCLSPDFDHYEIYVARPGHDLEKNAECYIDQVQGRQNNAYHLDGLKSTGQYQVLVVAVKADGSVIESNILERSFGIPWWVIGLALLLIAGAVVAILHVSGLSRQKTGRKRE